jgi:arylsulfatase A-like enzyme
MRQIIALAALLAATTSADAARKPNVIVILADDLGYADVGFNGCKDIPTPNIDSLARHGVRCSNGYVSHSFCSPTRAGLMTGRYQQRFGHENNPAYLPEDTKVGLPLSQKTIADVMKSAGYVTGAIGKWHLGAAPCFHPNARGFVEYFGFLGGGHIYLPGAKGGVEYNVPLLRNKEPLELKDYMTDVLSAEAAAFVARHKAGPFYLYVAYNAVHTPLQAPEKYLSRFAGITDERRRTYAAMNSAMDDGIGRILRALRDSGIERDTMVWFFSDNGGPVETVAPTRNDPLRGHKGTLYEGGIRVPFVVQWRAGLPEGAVCEQPVIALDVLPTVAALAGAKLPDSVKLDGVNIAPHLKGEAKTPPHERLFWRMGGGASWAVREGRHKLVKPGKDVAPQLFDLNKDIGEAKDLTGEKPDVAARLQKAFDAWNAELIPPIFESPRPAAKKAKQAARKK